VSTSIESSKTDRRYWRVRPWVGITASIAVAVLAALLVTAFASPSVILWLLP
jgi:hypothetical protein